MVYNLSAAFILSMVKLCIVSFLITAASYFMYADTGNLLIFLLMWVAYNPMVFLMNFFIVYLPVFFAQRKFIESNDGKPVLQKLLPVAILPACVFISAMLITDADFESAGAAFFIDTVIITALGFYFFVKSYQQISWKIN